MNRRIRMSFVVACAMAGALCGCESWRQQTRVPAHADIPLISDDETTKPKKEPSAVPGTPEWTRGFFRPGRLSGAWSSEAAEVERDLGVGP